MQLHKFFLATIMIVASTGVGVTSAHSVTSDYPDYTVEDGVTLDGLPVYVDSCDEGGDFTVTIDGVLYETGDVAFGFSLQSDFSFTAAEGVDLYWVIAGVVQDGYGHGMARLDDEGTIFAMSGYDAPPTNWQHLAPNNVSYLPGVFFALCDAPEGTVSHIQAFPGLTFQQVGLDMDLEGNFSIVDNAAYEATLLGDPDEGGIAFAPLSNFANAGYGFWAAFLEDEYRDNDFISVSAPDPVSDADYTQASWGYAFWMDDDDQLVESASGFYTLGPGCDSLSESSLDSVYEAPAPCGTIENRGIFLYIAGQPAGEVKSTPVYFGSVGTKADSTYILSVQSVTNPALTRTVLATGSTNSWGHADRRIELGNLAPGTYKMVMTGVHGGGYPLVLTNYISVDRDGNFISLSPESLQPTLN